MKMAKVMGRGQIVTMENWSGKQFIAYFGVDNSYDQKLYNCCVLSKKCLDTFASLALSLSLLPDPFI